MAYHSLSFGTGSRTVNTWEHWHIVPEERPCVNPPQPRTTYIEIPGMDGSLDYSEALGDLKYEMREGSWTFYVMNDYLLTDFPFNSWDELYDAILDTLHGQKLQVWLEDDPKYVYEGRFEVDRWESLEGHSKVTINYKINPYKYKAIVNPDGTVERDVINSTSGYDWLWDDLFNVDIYYGRFDVHDYKARIFKWTGNGADSDGKLEISVQASAPMYAIFNEKRYDFKPGRNKYSGIKLDVGLNEIEFYGNGQITIDYDKDGVTL